MEPVSTARPCLGEPGSHAIKCMLCRSRLSALPSPRASDTLRSRRVSGGQPQMTRAAMATQLKNMDRPSAPP